MREFARASRVSVAERFVRAWEGEVQGSVRSAGAIRVCSCESSGCIGAIRKSLLVRVSEQYGGCGRSVLRAACDCGTGQHKRAQSDRR